MAFKMKGSPFKQTSAKKADQIGYEGNTKKAKNKPKEKTVTDFTSDTQDASGPKTNKSNQHRTWKDFHSAEKGAALFVGGYMVPSAIVNTIKAFRNK